MIAAPLFLMAGCNGVGYYMQSVSGQLEMWSRERPVAEVIADPATDEALRQKLVRVAQIREFASRELKLPENASYRTYADLGRPYAVWNVFAAPEFSIVPVQWCFPVAGCVAYRGYFERSAAERFAAAVAAEGRDTYIGGVPAYSTLGYFSDPLLNTFIHYPDVEIARLLFHELAHQVAYARDDAHKDELLRTEFSGRGKVEIGRFKGLGEMMAAQLKETTMDPRKRTLLRVVLVEEEAATKSAVEALMGTKPEARFRFIQERAEFVEELDI